MTASRDQNVVSRLPFLRRHARMMLGRQREADLLVTEALTAFERGDGESVEVALFRALHRVMALEVEALAAPRPLSGDTARADARLSALSAPHRAVLLLTSVEGLPVEAVARVLGRPAGAIAELLDEAQTLLERDLETSVLIIEDEWAIARDLRKIVGELGHSISAVAATRADAIEAARRERPGLILADVQLADASCGIDAVRDIWQDGPAPTVFITGFPEKLLTGQRPEPLYLIAKPYSANAVQATISQALFFSDPRARA